MSKYRGRLSNFFHTHNVRGEPKISRCPQKSMDKKKGLEINIYVRLTTNRGQGELCTTCGCMSKERERGGERERERERKRERGREREREREKKTTRERGDRKRGSTEEDRGEGNGGRERE